MIQITGGAISFGVECGNGIGFSRRPMLPLEQFPLPARRAIIGLQPKRAEVILAGACIVRTVMQKLGKQSLTVSDRGLRHGVLAERFGA